MPAPWLEPEPSVVARRHAPPPSLRRVLWFSRFPSGAALARCAIEAQRRPWQRVLPSGDGKTARSTVGRSAPPMGRVHRARHLSANVPADR
jgi:hypothetical protein